MNEKKLEKKIKKDRKKLEKKQEKLNKMRKICSFTGEPHKFEVVRDTHYYLHGHHGTESKCIFCNKKQ